jgi:Tol biopolymer transport system component
VLVVVLVAAGGASAAAPAGPRLAVERLDTSTLKPKNPLLPFGSQLLSTGPLGEEPLLYVNATRLHSLNPTFGFSWSPDGTTLAFAAGRNQLQPFAGDIYLINSDGSGLRRLTHVGDASQPVFSPDGGTVYFQRVKERLNFKHPSLAAIKHLFQHFKVPKNSIWTIGVDGSGQRRLARAGRSLSDVPTSVSPLTGQIAISRSKCNRKLTCRTSAWLLDPATGAETPLGGGIQEPVFSPDGRRISFFRGRNPRKLTDLLKPTDLYVLDLSTGAVTRLTNTPHLIEAGPSWDPSGQRLAYVRSGGSARIFEVNADGSCPTAATLPPRRDPSLYEGVAWEPGAGREAGQIAC